MASWFERGRPAIFKVLQEVCDTIDSDLSAELQERAEKQHGFLSQEVERLRSRAATVDGLEQENRALRDEVAALRDQIKSASSVRVTQGLSTPRIHPTRQPLGEVSANTPSRLLGCGIDSKERGTDGSALELAELRDSHAKLLAVCEQLKRARNDATKRARKFLDDKDQWKKYAESLERKIETYQKRLDQTSGLQSRSSTEPEPQPGPTSARAGTSPAGPTQDSTSKATLASSVPPQNSSSVLFSGLENAFLTDWSPRRAVSTPPKTVSDKAACDIANSTESDDDNVGKETAELPHLPAVNNAPTSTTIKDEPSSDPPVIVSERRVGKRKRSEDGPNAKIPRTSQRVKTEEGSSDPVITAESHHFSPQESLDLDLDGVMPTPRKVRLLQLQDHAETSEGDNDNTARRPRTFDFSSPCPNSVLRDTVRAPDKSNEQLRIFFASSPDSKTSRTRETGQSSRLKLSDGVASLADDGYDPTRIERQARQEDVSATPSSRATRLEALLNPSRPSSQAQAALLRPNRQSREVSRSNLWLSDTPTRILPFGKGDAKGDSQISTKKAKVGINFNSGPANATPASRVQTASTGAPGILDPKGRSKPLREQPLASLRLEDFRINPKCSNGQDYAFSEVVRNKSERADLPGCTDPECCGKHFRAMAQAELDAAGPSLIHRPADMTLLEDYLGEQVSRLGCMTREEKEQVWLEAKTRELANKHGKHRHRFSRRQSPPGFWNADFPSTQEMQKDREEGEKREKRMIEERWREAMRDGGRWLFRDE